MLQTASNIVSDNLQNVVTTWPDIETLDPFYVELADAIIVSRTDGEGGIDAIKQHLSEVQWASRKAKDIHREYQGRMTSDADTARKLRKQAFARIADVVEEVADDLAAISEARDTLKTLPDIRPDEPTIVVAGYPNVGKSSFVNLVTNARNETASYPFTTTQIRVGHLERDRIRYRATVDTPGLLDRPRRSETISSPRPSAPSSTSPTPSSSSLDPSGSCGYPLDVQLELRDAIEARFDVPVLTIANKSDLTTDVEADHYMSVTEEDNVDGVLDAAIEAVGYEIELPFDE